MHVAVGVIPNVINRAASDLNYPQLREKQTKALRELSCVKPQICFTANRKQKIALLLVAP